MKPIVVGHRKIPYLICIILSVSFLHCPGSGGGGGDGLGLLALLGGGGGDTDFPPTTHTIGGTVSGLSGGEEVVISNGSDALTISANGSFTFGNSVANGSSYNVQVDSTTAPACTAGNNTGTVASQDITDVSVVCGTPQTLSVRVTDQDAHGSLGSGLVFQNNGADDTAVGSFNTNVNFTTNVVQGAPYSVTVKTQPSNPDQVCSPATSGSGTMPAGPQTVTFNCSTTYYTVSVSVSGLNGTGLRLRNNNNAGDEVTPVGNGSYSFGTQVAGGAAYNVTIQQQPSNLSQTCTLGSNASGNIGSNVTVSVTCTTDTFTVGGNITGLGGSESITLQLNGGNNITITNPTTTFAFPAIADGSAYTVTVISVPANKGCYVTDGAGTLAGANITNVAITCSVCSGGGGTKSVSVTWDASRSYDVKTASGGFHRIFYKSMSGVSKTDSYVQVANTTSTTTGTISNLWPGCTYYVRVAGYSSLNSSGGSLSDESSISIPLN